MAEAFRREGAKEVTLLRGRTLDEVDALESLAALRRATGVWFGGGRQWRFVDAYDASQALEEMRGVLRRGGVIGGSSAGASIQAEYMVRGSPLGNREMMAPGYERGFGFLPGAAVDQHFTQRNRFADMTALMRRHPQLLGIGIDEATALIVRGGVAEVIGRHRVCFYDGRAAADGAVDYESVAAGGKFDLVERKVVEQARN
jgi:cyanophycinase